MADAPFLSKADIVYMDDAVVAVNKPCGMLVHRSHLDRRSPTVMRELRSLTGKMVWPVHRLDRPTSGILLMAFGSELAAVLNEDFRHHRVEKEYLAVVRGYADTDGVVDHPVKNSRGNPKPAVSRYRRLAEVELPMPVGRYDTARYSLVKVALETGRYHQIRQHFHHLSHPIIGDTVYGDGRHNRFFRETLACRRLLLFSVALAFPHPVDGRIVSLGCGLGEEERALFERFGWAAEVPTTFCHG
ncbi:pseudouridine synthase [Desulfoluna spongiiphila]|uniref:pseudouridine synthase n=1 Tax=Desulfoluna spongiiphila TaxID=419481 RepID=UPI001253CE87|nr:pseudouridine synthase [Desulfoluna spongiiphila]VVS95249.1 pseudouridine synthase rsua/rlub/c/d/e/f [Desulfoluna spongiiphila]